MTAAELLATLERYGVVITAQGDRLWVEAPRGAVTQELREALLEQKSDLLDELSRRAEWPLDSLEAERRFGVAHARLFPFLGKTVNTPDGPGRLVQVFAERVAVDLGVRSEQARSYLPSEIRLPGVAAVWPGELAVH